MTDSHTRKLALAIAYLRTQSKRGYVLDSSGPILRDVHPEPPPKADRVTPILRKVGK